MEIEYKWNLSDEKDVERLIMAAAAAGSATGPNEVHMHATYYDTAKRDVYHMHGGLRIRRENAESVCCLKLTATSQGDCKTRREYEVDAADIREGLEKLPDAGAPREICEQLLANGPAPTCETAFVRRAYAIAAESFAAELAIDTGELRRNGKTAPIHEIELEYESGSEDAFHAFAARLQDELGLSVQELSKLARAMAL